MKYIKLTNDVAEHKGNPLYINVDSIVTVSEVSATPGGSLKTVIFAGQTGWEVEQSVGEVLKLIEGAQNDSRMHGSEKAFLAEGNPVY